MNFNLKLKMKTIVLVLLPLTTHLFSQKLNKENAISKQEKYLERYPKIGELNKIIALIRVDSSSSEIESTLNRIAYFPNMKNYLNIFLSYPEDAREYGIEGVVKAEVEVNEMGEIIASKIVQKLGFGCDEAVLKLLNHMPNWKPRLINGVPRRQKLIIPVKFFLY